MNQQFLGKSEIEDLISLDPNEYFQAYPENLEYSVELKNNTTGTFLKFNRKGNLLALGQHDGNCKIIDTETKSEVRILKKGIKAKEEGHFGCISTITWCNGGSKVLTSSYDCKVILWSLDEPKIESVYNFESAILLSQANPRIDDICIVFPYSEIACVIDLKTEKKYLLPITRREPLISKGKKKPQEEIIVGTWNKKGDKIYIGNSLGLITIISFDEKTKELKVIHSFYISGGSGKGVDAVDLITFSKRGKYYSVLCGEKIRLFDSETNEILREFKDVINSVRYGFCGFSGKTVITDHEWDSDYLIASSGSKISIWDRVTGTFVKELENAKNQILCFDYHPYQAILVSSTITGQLTFWGRNYKENWSAFAPDFLEMEENEFYVEKEDEFDVKDENTEINLESKKLDDEEETNINITICEKSEFFDSDVSEDEYYLPIFPIKQEDTKEEGKVDSKKKKKTTAKKRKLSGDSDEENLEEEKKKKK
eukprot:gene9571-1774_t